ncbi:MAG: hypothetical protein LBD36_01605, partial [Holosporales bacterium]|nr:hypothetical protein [Holosporales bacterium]
MLINYILRIICIFIYRSLQHTFGATVINDTITLIEDTEYAGFSGSGTINAGSYTLTINNTASCSFSGSVNSSGQIVKEGIESQTICSTSSITGNVIVKNGMLVMPAFSGGIANVLKVEGGTYVLNGNQSFYNVDGNGDVVVNNTLTIDSAVSGSMYFYNVRFSGNGSLVFSGTPENFRGVCLNNVLSQIGQLSTNNTALIIGKTNTSSIQCTTLNVGSSNSGDALVIGLDLHGNGVMTCTNMYSYGWIQVGANGGVGQLNCTGTLTQTGNMIEIGAANYNAAGKGTVTAGNVVATGCGIYVGTNEEATG